MIALGAVFLVMALAVRDDDKVTKPGAPENSYPALAISFSSQAFANLQSRSTVTDETFKTSAISSTEKPPKNRSSTTSAFRLSVRPSRSRASSRARNSELLWTETMPAPVSVTA
jgi:hypothetical protein